MEKFISDSKKGRRLQPNGKRLSVGTIYNYIHLQKTLEDFSARRNFQLRFRPVQYLNNRELIRERNYWKKFYKQFTDYLYRDIGCFDNFAGSMIKNVRVFFNYLNRELTLGIGDFHKSFYVRRESIVIHTLLPEELNFLITDNAFEALLSHKMRKVKDVFVFGCTVALRVSDLITLRLSNIRHINGHYYLIVRSVKTSADSMIKLPPYAVNIVLKYKNRGCKTLLPYFEISKLNKLIKKLLELAGFTGQVSKTRERRGEIIEILPRENSQYQFYRFCDLASTHLMRRTAITTMLSLGMPESMVRKISGHCPGSKEFYRYVNWAQSFQDQETEKVFERLRAKTIQNIQHLEISKK